MEKIGKYVIVKEVGKGSTGTVYLSHDPFYGRDVAIKVYNNDGGSEEDARVARKMFFNEANMVGMLQHPNILPIYDAGEEDGRYYVVGHMGSRHVSVLDLRHPDRGVREVSIMDPSVETPRDVPVKLPHMASWAVAGDHVIVPLVGEPRLAVLNRRTWEFEKSIVLRGHPVYTVRSPA